MQDDDIGAWSAKYISRTIGAVTRLTGLSVCLYDLSRLRTLEGVRNVAWRHESAFCTAVRMLPEGRAACIQSDVIEGVAQAEREGCACLHTCHAGLCELIVPVMLEDRMIGEAFLGQCRLKGGLDWPSVERCLRPFGKGVEQLKARYYELPVVALSDLWDAAALLDNSFRYLVSRLGENALSSYCAACEPSHVERARKYIDDHFSLPIGAGDVARELHITAAHLTRLFQRDVGKSVTDYITHRRIERACEYLRSSEIPIGSLAVNVGFPDQNYFTRRFRAITGLSPSAYRKKYRETT